MSFHQHPRRRSRHARSSYRPRSGRATGALPRPVAILLAAAAPGLASGVGSVLATPGGASAVGAKLQAFSVAMRPQRTRMPQPGDYWGGCRDAGAAGTAPIYSDEPGYRAEMDGDGDGIACEPYRGY